MKSVNKSLIAEKIKSLSIPISIFSLAITLISCGNSEELANTCQDFNRKFDDISTSASNPDPAVMEKNIDLSAQLWDRLGVNGDTEAKEVCKNVGVNLDTEPVR